jgi:hypothetical protein
LTNPRYVPTKRYIQPLLEGNKKTLKAKYCLNKPYKPLPFIAQKSFHLMTH